MSKKLNESPKDKYKSIYGEKFQGNYLIGAKDKNKLMNEILSEGSSPIILSENSISVF